MSRLLMLVVLCTLLSGCNDDFYRARQQWSAYRQSPAYYQDTYYGSVHTKEGSTYCKTVCGSIECQTTCDSY